MFRNTQSPQAAVESAACHCAEGSGAHVFHQLPCLRSREPTRLLAGQSSAFGVGGEHTAGSTLKVSKGSLVVCGSTSDAGSFRRRTQNVQSQMIKLWKTPNPQGTKEDLWKLRLTSAVNFLDIQLRTDDFYCRSDSVSTASDTSLGMKVACLSLLVWQCCDRWLWSHCQCQGSLRYTVFDLHTCFVGILGLLGFFPYHLSLNGL